MKFNVRSVLLAIFLTFGLCGVSYAQDINDTKEVIAKKKYDENLGFKINRQVAKGFCGDNSQCADFIALELEDAYKQGVAEKREQNAWDLSIAKYARTKRNLCDNAPDKFMCYTYRNALITRYMAGLSSKG